MVSTTNINKIQYYANSRLPKRIFAQIFSNVILMLQSPFAFSIPSINTELPASHSHHMSIYNCILIISSLCVCVVMCYLLHRCREIKSAQELHPFHDTFSWKSLWASIPKNITGGLLLLSGTITHYYAR